MVVNFIRNLPDKTTRMFGCTWSKNNKLVNSEANHLHPKVYAALERLATVIFRIRNPIPFRLGRGIARFKNFVSSGCRVVFWPQMHVSNNSSMELKALVGGRTDDYSFIQIISHDDIGISLPGEDTVEEGPSEAKDRPVNTDEPAGSEDSRQEQDRLETINENSHEDSVLSYFGTDVPESAKPFLAEAIEAFHMEGIGTPLQKSETPSNTLQLPPEENNYDHDDVYLQHPTWP